MDAGLITWLQAASFKPMGCVTSNGRTVTPTVEGPSPLHMKMTRPSCPSCRLPLVQTGAVYVASFEGVPYAWLLCHKCFQRLKSLPAGVRLKSLNRCADAVAAHPARHPHRAFQTEDEARTYAALAADAKMSAEVVADLLA